MKPKINTTAFGSITIDNEKHNHDVLIRLNSTVKKRKKKLSKNIYGTSHVISLDEAKHIYEKGAKLLIVGSGQYDQVKLSEEASHYFRKKKCKILLYPTPKAIETWNKEQGKVIALFHVTC